MQPPRPQGTPAGAARAASTFTSTATATLALAAFAALPGCAHYTLGDPAETPFRTVYIAPVKNASYAPQAQALVTSNLVEAFLRDGSVRVVGEAEADAVLTLTLTDYEKVLSSTQADDTVLARSFNLALNAEATLIDARDGTVYFEARPIGVIETTFSEGRAGQGLPQAEYQTMPVLARHLAHRVKDAVLGVW